MMQQKGEWPNAEASGTLDCLDHAAAVMFHLGSVLMASDEKIRVTIERDPETGRFEIKREIICQ